MMSKRSLLAFALLLPILALFLWLSTTHIEREAAPRYILNIEGYDPFDVLRGHYLIYRVNYNISGLCRPRDQEEKRLSPPRRNLAYVCLEPKAFSYEKPSKGCKAFIRGHCSGTLFYAGIERYYIPEEHAKTLEKMVRGKSAQIEISVGPRGQGYVRDLLINQQSWKKTLK